MHTFDTVMKAFDRCLLALLAIIMASLVIISSASVVMRTANSPLVWSDELMRYLFVWLTMLGFVYASSKRAHIIIDIVDQYVPNRWQRWINTFNQLVILVFFTFLLIISFRFVSLGLAQISSALRWTMLWVYISFPIAFAGQILMSLKSIIEIWRNSPGEAKTYD